MMKKCEAMILLYDTLRERGVVVKGDFMSVTKVNELQFIRYIGDLRDFLALYHPDKQVVYKRSFNSYFLEKTGK